MVTSLHRQKYCEFLLIRKLIRSKAFLVELWQVIIHCLSQAVRDHLLVAVIFTVMSLDSSGHSFSFHHQVAAVLSQLSFTIELLRQLHAQLRIYFILTLKMSLPSAEQQSGVQAAPAGLHQPGEGGTPQCAPGH